MIWSSAALLAPIAEVIAWGNVRVRPAEAPLGGDLDIEGAAKPKGQGQKKSLAQRTAILAQRHRMIPGTTRDVRGNDIDIRGPGLPGDRKGRR